jgi:hypothetical protein
MVILQFIAGIRSKKGKYVAIERTEILNREIKETPSPTQRR